MAQAAGPLGNLAARQTDRQRASLFGKEGKRYLSEGIWRENLEAAGTPGEKVVSKSYQPSLLIIFHLT